MVAGFLGGIYEDQDFTWLDSCGSDSPDERLRIEIEGDGELSTTWKPPIINPQLGVLNEE